MKEIGLIFLVATTLCGLFRASAITRYVDLNGTNSTSPYTNWIIAATNIQDAVDAAVDGDEVVVTNGVYGAGGRAVYGAMTNRVAINKAVTVRSVNGPSVTAVSGGPAAAGISDGDGAVRCCYVGTNAVLSGFTLTNGFTRAAGDLYQEQSGAGAWCELSGVVSNCTLSGNSARGYGGGAYSGTWSDCTLNGNSAPYAGGAYNSTLNRCNLTNNYAYSLDGQYNGGFAGATQGGTLNNCTLTANQAYIGPGGARFGTLNNCTLIGNSCGNSGGGAAGATLNSCTLIGNKAANGGGADGGRLNNCTLTANWCWVGGGGTYSAVLLNCILTNNSANGNGGADMYSTLVNCTLVGNSATGTGGGTFSSSVDNCIVYYNSAPSNPNSAFSTLNYSCTTPAAGGSGNISNEPLFVNTNGWADLHLQSNSPCINSGRNAYAPGSTDADGNPRISGGTVDIGAYEFQNPASVISYAWLQSYGWPTDGSADSADADGDGMSNWQEWMAGTNPTNAASALRIVSANPRTTNVVVTWSSVSTRSYSVARATNLLALQAFSVVRSNIAGLAGTTSFTDTNPPTGGAALYRVAVQSP